MHGKTFLGCQDSIAVGRMSNKDVNLRFSVH